MIEHDPDYVDDYGTLYRCATFEDIRVSASFQVDGDGILAIALPGKGPEVSTIILGIKQLRGLISALESVAPLETTQPPMLRILPKRVR